MKRMWSKNQLAMVYVCTSIIALTSADIEPLKAGDIVIKKDSSGNHPYVVTFRNPTGICLTYSDAYCVETQSYDKVDGEWVYNSEDKTIYAEPAMENIVDEDGHKRFIEGDIELKDELGNTLENVYGKWSLSGTHLMLVLCLRTDENTTISSQVITKDISLPKWVRDKIVPTFANYVEIKSFTGRDDSVGNATTISAALLKGSGGQINIGLAQGITHSVALNVRVAFDLLIDNE